MGSSGGGLRKQIPVTVASPANPTVGHDITYLLPSGGSFGPGPSYPAAFEIVAFRATLTTSSTVASRLVLFYTQDAGGRVLGSVASSAAQVASNVYAYSLMKGVAPQSQAFSGLSRTEVQLPLWQGLWLPAGGQFWTYTNNIQTTDQWSGIEVSYQAAA